MPGPIMQAPQLPEWADPQNESVMSPLWKEVARRAVHVMGLDDPQSQMMQAAAGTPLITHFPNQATRELGTQKFLKNVEMLRVPETLKAALRSVADKYPRIAAHILPDSDTVFRQAGIVGDTNGYNAYVQAGKPQGPFKKVPMAFTDQGIYLAKGPQGANEANRMAFHEATHVAQALGNKDMPELYNLANEASSYDLNPFEVSARNAGARAENPNIPRRTTQNVTPEVTQWREHVASLANKPADHRMLADDILHKKEIEAGNVPYTVDRGLQNMIDWGKITRIKNSVLPSDAIQPQSQNYIDATNKIQDILTRRAAAGWKPSGQ